MINGGEWMDAIDRHFRSAWDRWDQEDLILPTQVAVELLLLDRTPNGAETADVIAATIVGRGTKVGHPEMILTTPDDVRGAMDALLVNGFLEHVLTFDHDETAERVLELRLPS